VPILRVAAGREETLRVPVQLPGRTVQLRVWVTHVGRVPLLLLDSYSTHNDPADRYTTSLLYVRGRELRLEQEIILGRGAVAVLDALGIQPRVWHMNEGHSAFLALENVRRCEGHDLEASVDRCRSRHVFTTHTPVPAGNEVFERELVRPYLTQTAHDIGCSEDDLLELGNAEDGHGAGFNLTRLALELSHKANGVSELHADVSRRMWPDYAIQGITNGIHVATWLGREMSKVLGPHAGADPAEAARRAVDLPDETLWAAHTAQKHRLMRFVRVRALRQAARHGSAPSELRRIEQVLNPAALTLGFARRFAPYKRADLLFDDPGRLQALLCDDKRPVQLLMAGKAHPADRPGQKIIENIWKLASTPELRGRIVFVEDYDLAVARLMVRGVDCWLNTPEWPREASGTSGMKAAINGVLNASVPDGWWAEGGSDAIGFTIGTQENPDRARDSRQLYELLEQHIVPLFHERGDDGLPRGWIALMRNSMAACLGRFSTRRMLTEYAQMLYGIETATPATVG
jgi:starch phosphorylase